MLAIKPNWPAPANISAYTTTRMQGASLGPFASFNIAEHVDDHSPNVAQNRKILMEELSLPAEPVWLNQVHGNQVINLDLELNTPDPIADAAVTSMANRVCVIMTADCLPILICNRAGTKVAAIHAGWRGLANGVIKNTIAALNEGTQNLLAWLGPAIGPQAFEVGDDVVSIFAGLDPQTNIAFEKKADVPGKWLANIFTLAKLQLNNLGITAIYGGDYCTFSDEKTFYSYRRDHGLTGRIATLIWLSA